MTFLIFAAALIGVVVIVLAVIRMYDERMHPLCDKCGDNLATIRPSLFDGNAYCVQHGPL